MASFFPGLSRGRDDELPQRRWQTRAGLQWLWAGVGALAGGAIPFYFWWIELLPLWFMLFPMLAGAAILLPAPLVLGMDARGVAVIVPGWLSDRYLWIPRDQLIRLEIDSGWLVATGSEIEVQGNLDCLRAIRQVGIDELPERLKLVMSSPLAANTLVYPLARLDSVARDEIELWMFREGRPEGDWRVETRG